MQSSSIATFLLRIVAMTPSGMSLRIPSAFKTWLSDATSQASVLLRVGSHGAHDLGCSNSEGKGRAGQIT